MLFVKYSSISILLISSLISSQIVNAIVAEKKCGEYIYKIKSIGPPGYEMYFKHYYQIPNKREILFHKSGPVFTIDATCLLDLKGRPTFVFDEGYGGNAAPEHNFGIYDLGLKKMLLKPDRLGNYTQAKGLLGRSIEIMNNEKEIFCCSSQLADEKEKFNK